MEKKEWVIRSLFLILLSKIEDGYNMRRGRGAGQKMTKGDGGKGRGKSGLFTMSKITTFLDSP